MTREAVNVDCARTAFGKRKGALAGWHPTDLLGLVLRTMIERNDFDPAIVDDVVGGCVTQAGEQGCNVTRNAWVAAGLPWSVPATSVDRQCGSSQQAMHFVAQGVIAGAYDIAIACGVESMTRSPMSSNARGGTGPFSPGFLENTNNTLGIQFWVAQVLADKWGITREMDAFALQSPARRRVPRQKWPGRDRAGPDPGRERPAHRQHVDADEDPPDDDRARPASRRRGNRRSARGTPPATRRR
jgi:acetyl-CoA acyltransferase